MQVKITKAAKKSEYTVTMKLSAGALHALRNALVRHEEAGSAVGSDIRQFLDFAAIKVPGLAEELIPDPKTTESV